MTAHARWSDPQTSHDAAASVSNLRASQLAVLSVLRRYSLLSDTGLLMHYVATPGLPPQSESGLRTRRKELVELGEVEDSHLKATLPSGRKSILWRAVER